MTIDYYIILHLVVFVATSVTVVAIGPIRNISLFWTHYIARGKLAFEHVI